MSPVCVKNTLLGDVRTVGYWRDVIVEFLATFMLVSVQCALPLSWGTDTMGNVVQVGVGMGFIVTAMAWSVGGYGGGHMNPAVTISMVVFRKMALFKGFMYVVVQCLGGITAAGFVYGVTPSTMRDSLAATTLGPGVAQWQGFLVETWITFILLLTVHGSTDAIHRPLCASAVAPIPIGMAVALGIMTGFKHTGGSMNPARSLGPALVMGIWKSHWVYWAGPILGGIMAGGFYCGVLCSMTRYNDKIKTSVRPADSQDGTPPSDEPATPGNKVESKL